MATQTNNSSLHPIRIVIAIIIGIALLVIAYSMYQGSNNSNTSPAESIEQNSGPNGSNSPSSGSVDQGGNPSDATTPSPNGTNGNPMSSQ